MPLADSSRAIGAVTTLLSDRIEGITSHNVTVGRPEPPSANGGLSNPRLNLFLYEALFDATLRNTPLDDGQDAPLWLVLRFLLTPFDSAGESDTALAFGVLGDGLRALQQVAYLPLTGLQPTDLAALDVNPERLKVTFTESPASLLTSLMQGSEDRYRFSMSFEVRPIMIAPATPASYALLVGVDYTAPPPGTRGDRGLGITVEPTLGPVIERVVPASFKPGDPPVQDRGRGPRPRRARGPARAGHAPARPRRGRQPRLRPDGRRAGRRRDLRRQPRAVGRPHAARRPHAGPATWPSSTCCPS